MEKGESLQVLEQVAAESILKPILWKPWLAKCLPSREIVTVTATLVLIGARA